MTVKQLIAQLQDLPEDMLVIMSSDPEGNSYAPLEDLGQGFYAPTCEWSGDYYDGEEDDPPANVQSVVALWPLG